MSRPKDIRDVLGEANEILNPKRRTQDDEIRRLREENEWLKARIFDCSGSCGLEEPSDD